MEETSWCLSRPQMPASGEMVFSTDKTHAHTQRQTHTVHSEPSRSDGCQCESSVPERRSWYHSFSLCLSVFSLSLRRSEVCKIIHSSSLQSLHSLSDTHTQAGNTFVPSFIKKNWGIWWLNDPMHPLSLSSRYHIHFMQSSSWALPEGQPLWLTVSSLWLRYHISRDKYKGWVAWHL